MKGALHWAPIGNDIKKVNFIAPPPTLPLSLSLHSLSSMNCFNNTQILDIGTGTGTKTIHKPDRDSC